MEHNCIHSEPWYLMQVSNQLQEKVVISLAKGPPGEWLSPRADLDVLTKKNSCAATRKRTISFRSISPWRSHRIDGDSESYKTFFITKSFRKYATIILELNSLREYWSNTVQLHYCFNIPNIAHSKTLQRVLCKLP